MAHLDDQVAAFVDGQLTPPAMAAAHRHVQDCQRCRDQVAAQRRLKERMRSVAAPEPPPTLLASLAGLPDTPPDAGADRPRWSRWWRSSAWSAGAVLAGASLAVALTAWVAGAHEQAGADAVTPPFDAFVADFDRGLTSTEHTITTAALEDLDARGWPCHPHLAGDLERVDGRWHEGGSTVALTYSDGHARLRLFEQNGALADEAVEDLRPDRVAGRAVWVRDGLPRVVTWDADGVVYTIVTDVDDDRLARAVQALPSPREPRGVDGRVGDGLARMTAWVATD